MEQIDIRISRELFDKYVKEGILHPDFFSVLEVVDTDAFCSAPYIELMQKIHEEYDKFEGEKKAHRQTIKELYKQIDELQHGT